MALSLIWIGPCSPEKCSLALILAALHPHRFGFGQAVTQSNKHALSPIQNPLFLLRRGSITRDGHAATHLVLHVWSGLQVRASYWD